MEKSRQEIRAKGLLGTNPAIYIYTKRINGTDSSRARPKPKASALVSVQPHSTFICQPVSLKGIRNVIMSSVSFCSPTLKILFSLGRCGS